MGDSSDLINKSLKLKVNYFFMILFLYTISFFYHCSIEYLCTTLADNNGAECWGLTLNRQNDQQSAQLSPMNTDTAEIQMSISANKTKLQYTSIFLYSKCTFPHCQWTKSCLTYLLIFICPVLSAVLNGAFVFFKSTVNRKQGCMMLDRYCMYVVSPVSE